MSKLLIVHTVCTPPKVECQTISTSSQAVRKRQEVPFVQEPTLKIKEDLLHKLSRIICWKNGRERLSGLSGEVKPCLWLWKAVGASGEAMLGKQVRCCGNRIPSSFRGIRGSEGSAAARRT